MAVTNLTFQKSTCAAFIRSTCQARNRTSPSASIFSIVLARQPLIGFGTFDGSSTYGSLVYADKWPNVYNHLIETWVDSSGTYTQTTAYSQYWDIFQTTTGSPPPHSISCTFSGITDTLISGNYTWSFGVGTYSAQLGGTLLDDSAIGPFDPNDPSIGWAALAGLANNILSLVTPAAFTTGHQWILLLPKSTSPGYIQASFDTGPFADLLLASAFGYPTRSGSITSQLTLPAIQSIMDYLQPYNAVGIVPNSGACLCSKSIWKINGLAWSYSISPPNYINNDHMNIYLQPVSDSFLGGAIAAPGTLGGQPFSNPLGQGSIITFLPTDVTTNLPGGYHYGMLGFLAAAS